jgi:molybdopterin molybdotransferase
VSELISVEEAQRRILGRVASLEAERVPLERAHGRVLAEAAIAQVDLPPFASSAMDGYAVRAADVQSVPASLSIVGEAAAGHPAPRAVAPGEAVAISTGAVVPDGADAVVPIERTGPANGRVEVRDPVIAGAHVRPRGGDVRAGATLMEPGVTLGPTQVAALAAAGLAEVRCTKRPRVGILVTGSELRPAGSPLGPGQIYESNGLMLAAAVSSAGAIPAQLGVVTDTLEEHRSAMEKALLGFDMLITSGGASGGAHDLVREAEAALRVEEVFWGVSMKPGKPVGFGMRRSHPVFNLPGNPMSALVCFELLVRPAIGALLGVERPLPAFTRGVLAGPVTRNRDRDEYLRATASTKEGVVLLEPATGQESHMIVSAARANALIYVAAGEGDVASGSEVLFLGLG